MSTSYFSIVPTDPRYVPSRAQQDEAVAYFRRIAPASPEVTAEESEHVVFRDCGSNFESVSCPACGAHLSIEQWHELMDRDYDGAGFRLERYPVPCCGSSETVDSLRYHFPQGFSRFVLSARDPDRLEVADEERASFERLLGCAVRVLCSHY